MVYNGGEKTVTGKPIKHHRIKGLHYVFKDPISETITIRYETLLPKELTNTVDNMEIYEALGFVIINQYKYVMRVILPIGWFHIKSKKEEYLIDEKGRKRFIVNKKDKTMTGLDRLIYDVAYSTTEENRLDKLSIGIYLDGKEIYSDHFDQLDHVTKDPHDYIQEYLDKAIYPAMTPFNKLVTLWEEEYDNKGGVENETNTIDERSN